MLPAEIPKVESAARQRWYTTAEVNQITGATLRQLQWWDEKGVLRASRGDGLRRYTFRQVRDADKLRRLSRAGIPPRKAKRYMAMDWDLVVRLKEPAVVAGVLVVPDRRGK